MSTSREIAPPGPAPTAVDDHEHTSSRRHLLHLAAGAAAGGAAVALAQGSGSVSANDGDNVRVANITTQGNSGRTFTTINYVNSAAPRGTAGPFLQYNANVFLVRDNPPGPIMFLTPDQSDYPSAVAGYATGPLTSGLYGLSNRNNGYGVVAEGVASATGLLARGGRANLMLENAGDAPALRADAHARGEMIADGAGNVWYCTAAGTPGTWAKMSGPATAGSLHLIPPARVYDSRAGFNPPTVFKGRLNPGDERAVDCTVNASGVPANAKGVIVNLTAANTVGRGFLAVYPDGTPAPATSTVNYTPEENIANSTTVGCGPGAKIRVLCGGSTGADFIVDITGYYL